MECKMIMSYLVSNKICIHTYNLHHVVCNGCCVVIKIQHHCSVAMGGVMSSVVKCKTRLLSTFYCFNATLLMFIKNTG